MESARSPIILLGGAVVRMEIQIQFTSVWLLSFLVEQKWTGWSSSVGQDPCTSIPVGKVFSCCLLTEAVPGKALGGDALGSL